MDLTGRNRWASKVKQHRTLRRRALDPKRNPESLYEELTNYNGGLLEQWIAIFLNAWRRERPLEPEPAATTAREEIGRFIKAEERRINREVARLWPQDELAEQKAIIDEGKKRLRESCLVLKDKCLEAIDDARASRADQLRSEREQRKDRRWDKGSAQTARRDSRPHFRNRACSDRA